MARFMECFCVFPACGKLSADDSVLTCLLFFFVVFAAGGQHTARKQSGRKDLRASEKDQLLPL